jgi:mannitol-specific phosphotransferase system IIBC component
VKYTLARFGLLLAALLVVLPIPRLDLILKLLIAFAASFVLSWFLLRRMRDEMALDLARSSAQRRERKEQLRAALAGDDEPPAGDDQSGPSTR